MAFGGEGWRTRSAAVPASAVRPSPGKYPPGRTVRGARTGLCEARGGAHRPPVPRPLPHRAPGDAHRAPPVPGFRGGGGGWGGLGAVAVGVTVRGRRGARRGAEGIGALGRDPLRRPRGRAGCGRGGRGGRAWMGVDGRGHVGRAWMGVATRERALGCGRSEELGRRTALSEKPDPPLLAESTPSRRQKGCSRRLLPARAGMVSVSSSRCSTASSAPRACGDGPPELPPHAPRRGCSPRVRGWPLTGTEGLFGPLLLPACARMAPVHGGRRVRWRRSDARAVEKAVPRCRAESEVWGGRVLGVANGEMGRVQGNLDAIRVVVGVGGFPPRRARTAGCRQ